MIEGKYTEPDILKFKKEEMIKVIEFPSDLPMRLGKVAMVGDDGVYFTSLQKHFVSPNEIPIAYAEGCNPKVDEFDDWWELKRATWGGDDGVEYIDRETIQQMLTKCRTHLIVAFKEDSFEVMPDTIGE